MSKEYKIANPEGVYYLTLTVVDWIDLFSRAEVCDILSKNLNHCVENRGLEVFAYVIMTNHVHMVVRSAKGKLGEVIRDFKKFSSREIVNRLQDNSILESRKEWLLYMFSRHAQKKNNGTNFQIWQYGSHAKEIENHQMMLQKINYIHMNPVRARIVREIQHYFWSSARDYAGDRGEVKVVLV